MRKKTLQRLGITLILLSIVTAGLVYGKTFYKRLTYKNQNIISVLEGKRDLKPVSQDFGLIIPALDINVKIISDVSGKKKLEYDPKLAKEGVGHMKETPKPNEGGNMVLFGHSSSIYSGDFSTVFVNLDRLKNNDMIFVYFKNNLYEYKVSEIKEVDPSEVGVTMNTPDHRLTIFTCWPPGTKFKRMIITAKISKINYY